MATRFVYVSISFSLISGYFPADTFKISKKYFAKSECPNVAINHLCVKIGLRLNFSFLKSGLV